MNNLEERLNQVLTLIEKKDYLDAGNIIENLLKLEDEELKKYLKLLIDLLSVITSLTLSQRDIVKNISIDDVVVNQSNEWILDVSCENYKRSLILNHNYSMLIKKFDNWDSNIYDTILELLITIAFKREKEFKKFLLNDIHNKKYEHARTSFINKATRQHLEKSEKITHILLEQIVLFMSGKVTPKKNFVETDNYFEAIANNDFEFAFELIEKYNIENKIDLNCSPNYLLLRDICKVLRNNQLYENFCQNHNLCGDENNSFLQSKYEDIKQNGLITIKSKNKEKFANILKELIKYPDITGMLLFDDETLLLKYTPYIDSNKKISKLMPKANKLLACRKAEAALKIYLEILKYEDIKSVTYSKIGFCYVALKNYSKAIEYLTIAMEIGKKENQVLDFYSLIAKLEGRLLADDVKPVFNSRDNRFDFYNEHQNFGLGDLTELNSNIILSGLDVESACQSLGVSKEKTELIKLVYAREFFSKGEDKIAEKFIKSVELSDNKTPRIINALNEVRKNKKMYINKKETTLELSLKLKPKKTK